MQSILWAEFVHLGIMVIRYTVYFKGGISISECIGLVGDHPSHAWSHFKEVDKDMGWVGRASPKGHTGGALPCFRSVHM